VFQQRFADITEAQRWTYVVTLLLSVVTAGLLVAPRRCIGSPSGAA
jgi:hypothetical protein